MIFIYILCKGYLNDLKEFMQVKFTLSTGSLIACLALGLQFYASVNKSLVNLDLCRTIG